MRVFETMVARSPFRREALALRRLRRPAIDPVLRPNATAMALSDRPSAFRSRSSSSSDGFHGLLLFFGMVRGDPVRAASCLFAGLEFRDANRGCPLHAAIGVFGSFRNSQTLNRPRVAEYRVAARSPQTHSL